MNDGTEFQRGEPACDQCVSDTDQLAEAVTVRLLEISSSGRQPSAWELVEDIEATVGLKARWLLLTVLERLVDDRAHTTAGTREFWRALRWSRDLEDALRGESAPRKEVSSAIDSLLRQSTAYRGSAEFADMVSFMGSFRDYAPFNNLLVRLQNPSCSFFATESDWRNRFQRTLKEDARPMLILAPMHPVMLVYELDQTEGAPVPKEAFEFAKFQGEFDPTWLERVIENAARHDRIRIDRKTLSSTNAGFATIVTRVDGWKMRIAIHDELDEASQFGVLCHELAHIYLGHLGTDGDRWWPSRRELSHHTVEIEAEAAAFIVATRFGLEGSSAEYVSRHIGNNPIPPSVSLDLIAKVASRIEKMALGTLKARPQQPRRVR